MIYLSESFVPCASILNVPTFKTFLSFKDGLISTIGPFSIPVVNVQDNNIWLLGIYPEYHTKLFPDSALRTENHILNQLINDVTPANSIKKIYIARMQGMEQISRNDVVVIYRTAEKGKSAEYSSVATSICIVDKNKSINSFKNIDEFLDYSKYSIFSEKELKIEFANKNNYVPYIIVLHINNWII